MNRNHIETRARDRDTGQIVHQSVDDGQYEIEASAQRSPRFAAQAILTSELASHSRQSSTGSIEEYELEEQAS